MVLCCLGAATAESLPDDAKLDAPVTLAVKGEALTDVLEIMQGQTGVRLRAGRDVADQKVTIFVDEKPLRKVMEGLSLLLEYHWTSKDLSSGRVYEIWEDEKTRLRRKVWCTKALAKAWEQTDADLKRLSELRAMTPDQLARLLDQLSAKLGTGGPEALKDWSIVRRLSDNPNIGTVVGIHDALSPKALQALRSGMTLHFDSLSDEKEWLISEDAARQLIYQDRNTLAVNGETAQGESINLAIRATADRRGVYVSAESTVRRRDSCVRAGINLCQNLLRNIHPLPANHLPQEGIAPLDEMKVSWAVPEIAEEASLPVEQPEETRAVANRSDILALLHKKLGLQIIADHYSEWSCWHAAKDRPLKEILVSFEAMYDHTGGRPCDTYSGADAEFLYMRAKDVRLCNLREIPDRLLRPWQAAYEKQGCLGLNELGEIALLTDDQIPYDDSRLLGIGDRPVTSPVLKLYGALTPKQRKEAFSGGTPVSAFSAAQKTALVGLLPDQKSGKDIVSGVMVGIYRDGWRVDSEEPVPASADRTPAAVVMDDETITEEYRYEINSNGGKAISVIPAKSVQQAWETIRAQRPGAKKDSLILVKSRRIKATVRFEDGSTTEQSVDLPSRIPYSRTAEQAARVSEQGQ